MTTDIWWHQPDEREAGRRLQRLEVRMEEQKNEWRLQRKRRRRDRMRAGLKEGWDGGGAPAGQWLWFYQPWPLGGRGHVNRPHPPHWGKLSTNLWELKVRAGSPILCRRGIRLWTARREGWHWVCLILKTTNRMFIVSRKIVKKLKGQWSMSSMEDRSWQKHKLT